MKVVYFVISTGIAIIILLTFLFLNLNESSLLDFESKIYPSSLDGVPYEKMPIVEIKEDQVLAKRFNILNQEGRNYSENQVRHSVSFIAFNDSKSAKDYFEFNPNRFELIDTNGVPLDFDMGLITNLDAEHCKSTKRGNYSGFSMFAVLCHEQNYIFGISSFTQLENIDETISIDFAKEMLDKIHSQTKK